jgi:hypothetical protein
MTKADLGLPSGSKAATYQQNRGIKPETAFMSKAELRKTIESMSLNECFLLREILRLKRQRTEDLATMNNQQEKIIVLYNRINSESNVSPLMKAG